MVEPTLTAGAALVGLATLVIGGLHCACVRRTDGNVDWSVRFQRRRAES